VQHVAKNAAPFKPNGLKPVYCASVSSAANGTSALRSKCDSFIKTKPSIQVMTDE
jgi:hypothetical protein